MFENLISLFAKTPGTTISWTNALYRKSMSLLLTVIFGYLALLWALTAYGGAGAITMTMWGFLIIFTFFYWQPAIGGLGAIVEWFNKKDDPNMKSTWRLYLMVLIAAVVAGTFAIIFQMIGAHRQFPFVILTLVTFVIIGLLLPGNNLDKWLPRIGMLMLVLAVMGTFSAANPLILARFGINSVESKITKSEELAKAIADKDIALQDARRIAQLNRVNAIRECDATKSNIASWTPDQVTVYGIRCNTTSVGRGITLGEIEKYWPKEFVVWQNSYGNKKPLTLEGTEKSGSGNLGGNNALSYIAGLGLLHLLGIVLIGGGLGAIGYKLVKTKSDDGVKVVEKKVEVKSDATKNSTLIWLIFLGLLGYGGYNYWDSPMVAKILGTDGGSIHTDTQFNPSLSVLEYNKWIASYRSINFHKELPQDAWHGKMVKLMKGSYVTDVVDLTVIFDPANPNYNISFTGNCVAGTRLVPKICEGYWNAGEGMTGVYRLEWDSMGRTFLIKMYEEQYIRSDYGVLPIKEIRVRDKVTG